MSPEAIRSRKREIMIRFSKYQKRKYVVPEFGFDDSLDEMEFALERFEKNLKYERDIKFYRILIIGSCWLIEKGIDRTGHDLGLKGWWKHIQKTITEFDEYLEEIVRDGINCPPEIRLAGAIAMSALSYSAMNNLPTLAKLMSTQAGEFFTAISGNIGDSHQEETPAAPGEMRGPQGVDFLLDEIKRDNKKANKASEKAAEAWHK